MSEYLRELENHQPGTPMPPINVGPYDNPLLWNMLDPFGADRGHQRRPMSLSRDTMELYDVPLTYRDQCVHRYIPYMMCMRNTRPMLLGHPVCHEFDIAFKTCRSFETYRYMLLKTKYEEATKDYTAEDKRFFPSGTYTQLPFYTHSFYWSLAASARLSGWDEKDPANPVMWREPNRALMRAEFAPTNWETGMVSAGGTNYKKVSDTITQAEMPYFPLPENKRPTAQ